MLYIYQFCDLARIHSAGISSVFKAHFEFLQILEYFVPVAREYLLRAP